MKRFNTTGKMIADQHYMVPIDRQVNEAARMVEDNLYFCINRGRQYGKTTTLAFLKQKLEVKGYVVFSISFEGLPDSAYESLETLIYASLEKMVFSMQLNTIANFSNESAQLLLDLQNRNKKYTDVQDFVATIAAICSKERLVLLIDEVDQAGNYPSFVKFLGVLREMYLRRDEIPTFYSVILAGVYDIKKNESIYMTRHMGEFFMGGKHREFKDNILSMTLDSGEVLVYDVDKQIYDYLAILL